MKQIIVRIADAEWEALKPYIDHHGQISSIVRKALKAYIREERKKDASKVDQGRGASET